MWHQIKSGYEKAQTCCWNPSAGWVLRPSGAQENLKKAIWAYLSELELGTGKVPRPGSEGRLAGSLCLCTAGCPRAVTAHPVALFSSLFPFSLHLHLLSQRKCKSPSWVRVPLFLSFTSVFFPRQPGAELELPGSQQIYGNSRVTFQDHISKPAPSSLGWAQDSGESHLVLCAFLPNTNLQSTSSTSDLCVQINPFPQTALHYFWYLNWALIKAGYAWV